MGAGVAVMSVDREGEHPGRPEPIRVVVGEGNYLVREGINQALTADRAVRVVGLAGDLESVRALILEHDPDVVLTDIRMPPTGREEGIQIADWLRVQRPHTAVILLSQFAEPDYALRLLEYGSNGRAYLLKDRIVNRAQLLVTIREVVAGRSVIDPKVVEGLLRVMDATEPSPIASLSEREREVLAAMAEGKSNAAIARSLQLTKGAVEKYINSIFQKLDLPDEIDVSRRVMATLIFLARGRS
jgi:DNA-binding NarL/FixJ family response regulator